MKRFRRASLLLLACAVALMIACPTAALANSARTQWEGVTTTGLLTSDEECPIVVDREVLTFDIREFPLEYYGSTDELLAYSPSVTAEYTFRNPADYAVKATLVFPFGRLPDYADAFAGYSLEAIERLEAAATQYGASIDGEPTQTVLRHTLLYPFDKFFLENDLPKLRDGYTEDPFYSPSLTVTKFTYEISGIPEGNDAATIGFRWTPREDAKILLMNQAGLQQLKDGENSVMVNTWAENDRLVEVYVFGNAPDGILAGLFKDGSCTTGVDGRITNVGTKAMSFEEFALQEWSEETGVLKHDWYNAMVDDLNHCEQGWGEGIIMRAEFGVHESLDLSNLLLRWYEYEIALEPGQVIANEVTAPIYPSIDAGYTPPIYGYSYLLSPAQMWSDFGTLDVLVKTPYAMTESNLEGFERLEGEAGYTLSLDGLPEGELEFTLSESENPKEPSFASQYSILLPMLAMVVAPLFLIGLLIGVLVGRRRKRR